MDTLCIHAWTLYYADTCSSALKSMLFACAVLISYRFWKTAMVRGGLISSHFFFKLNKFRLVGGGQRPISFEKKSEKIFTNFHFSLFSHFVWRGWVVVQP